VNKGGCSSNCKIDPAEFLLLMAKYALPFSKPVKSDHKHNYDFDIFRMITLKQQKFSQSDPVLIRQF